MIAFAFARVSPVNSVRLFPSLSVALGTCAAMLLASPYSRSTAQAQGQEGRTSEVRNYIVDNPRAWRSSENSLTFSLEDALRLALRNNLGLAVSERQTDIARLDALGSWGAFDPVFSARAALVDRQREGSSSLSGATLLEEDNQEFSSSILWPLRTGGQVDLSYSRTNDRTNNTFATFDVSTTDIVTAMVTQPLLRGAWSRFATTTQRQAEVALQRQVAAEEQVRQRMLLDVYNAYWDLVSARDQLEVRIVTYELGLEQLRQDQRRLDVGAGTEVDVLQSETNVAQAWEQLLEAANAVLAGEDILRRLLFLDLVSRSDSKDSVLTNWDWPITPSTALPEIAADDVPSLEVADSDPSRWRRSLETALDARPELAQARFDIETAEVQLERSRSDRRAQLDIELRASSVGFDSDPGNALSEAAGFDFPEYRGALVFSLPLWNRTAKNAERAARGALRNAQLEYNIRELDVLTEVRNAVRDVRYRAIAAQAARTSRRLAERQLSAEQARQRNGLSTTFQVLEFQKTLAEASSAERSTRATYAKSLAALRFAEGVLGHGAAAEAQDQATGSDRAGTASEGLDDPR